MSFKEDGFEIIENILSAGEINAIKDELRSAEIRGGGIRNAEKKLTSVATLVKSEKLRNVASSYLLGQVSFVRCIVFTKTECNNWLVTWHQDKTVSISKKFDDPSWGPWSEKEGVLHVQAPIEVLENMVSIRIHLDESTEENGCLRLIPGSHTRGLLPQQLMHPYVSSKPTFKCIAPLGSGLVMRPHVLHASSKSSAREPRRVLHVEYSSYCLPEGAQWT